MPHTKKAKSTLPKDARALKSSTPKRPATSPPPPPPTTSPSESENPKRNKTHVSPKFALPSSKSRPSTSNLLKDLAQSPQLPPRPSFRKLRQYTSLKPQRPPPLLNKKPPSTVPLPPHRQAVQHLATPPKPPHNKPQLFPILFPFLGFHAPL